LIAWLFAALFVCMIASIPLLMHWGGDGRMTTTTWVEAAVLFVWLCGGLYLFTHVLLFQSPHFGGKIRSLTLVEAVYLFSQIITTVGYGDITPAKPRGQVFVGIFVFFSIVLIAGMVSVLSDMIMARAASHVKEMSKSSVGVEIKALSPRSLEVQAAHRKAEIPVGPLLGALAGFCFFVLIGVLFFVHFPGENKTYFQGVYMSIITLTTVGFGAFTPVTQGGMVFGAFWMLFGVASLGAVVGAFTEYMMARKKAELRVQKKNKKLKDGQQHEMDSSRSADELLSAATSDGQLVDRLGFLRYILIKKGIMEKDQVEEIAAQFQDLHSETSSKDGYILAEVARQGKTLS